MYDMHGREIIRKKSRRKTDQQFNLKNELNFSKGIKPNVRYSITLSKERNIKNTKFSSSNNMINISSKNNINIIKKNFPLNNHSYFYPYRKAAMETDKSDIKSESKNDSKRPSMEKCHTTSNNFVNKKVNTVGKYNNNISFYKVNNIEDNIKRAINNMKNEIEKQTKFQSSECISPIVIRKKLDSSPNLIIYNKKKKKVKKKRKSSFSFNEINFDDNFFKKDIKKKKRNRSYDISEKSKKKLLIYFKNKIMKKSRLKLFENIKDNNSFNDESEDNNENSNGFAIIPTSNYIFVFDMLLIIADLYTFIFIPLTAAKNGDITERGHIFREIIHYIIDLIFLLDFIISLFRGYYNYEMEIIRNNKKIIIHYLKQYFVIDFLQAIPLYTLIRIFMKPSKNFYFGYFEVESIIITFLLFIKPFKIFKILKKKQNKALEDFYTYLSENYYLEQLSKFLIYFLIFFLFVHLFICLHIYFALQNYPNWIVYTNIINESFFVKYITSFYFMVTTMTTVGYGDIVCISFIERIYHIILLVIGTLLYTFSVSKLGNYLRDQSHEKAKLSKDLNILENIRITYPTMSFKLYSKIKSHLLSIFNKRKKTGMSLLINGVPDAIKNELLFKIYSKIINGFTIFKDVKNSNFIFNVLTSFIPIISKKEEIIILEGEIIQNIIFVKDGRLSLEIFLNIKEPYKSIQKYLEMDLTEILNLENIKNNTLNKSNSFINKQERNYNDLKERIDNVLLDNKNNLINNSIIDDNGISMDLGRLDFSRNDIDNDNYQIIKIIDVRKNEHFGDVHLDNPSPFTLKVKSRIAELLLLRKVDVILISNNYPNIWRRIQSKTYYNLHSLKKLTLKILKRYYNTYFYNKNTRENIHNFNLDVTKSTGIVDDRISFLKNLKTLYKNNTNNNFKTNINTSNILENTKINNSNFNKKKLYFKQENNAKIIGDTFSNDLNYSYNSFDLKSYNISNIKNTTININDNNKKEMSLTQIKPIEEKEQLKTTNPINNEQGSDMNKDIKNKTFDNLTFNNDTEITKINLLSTRKKLSNKKSNVKFNKFKTMKSYQKNKYSDPVINEPRKQTDKNLNYKMPDYEKINNYFHKNTEELSNNDDKNYKLLTLEDINENFSKRIKKKLKRKKKIQKLKQILKLHKIKVNKKLLDYNQNPNKKKINNINKDKNLNYSFSSSNYKIFSQILDSSNSEGNSSLIRKNNYFESQSLKTIISDSFEIKSSYQNINLLSKGKMIQDGKYKTFIMNKVKKYINKTFMNIDDNSKLDISSMLQKSKKEKKYKKYYKYLDTEIKNNDDNIFIFPNNLTSISKKDRYKNLIFEDIFKSSNKNVNMKTEKTTEKLYVNISEKKSNQKNKNSSKSCNKELENYSKIKQLKTIKNDNIDFNNYIKLNKSKLNVDGNKIKRENNIKKDQSLYINTSNLDINNKSIKNTFSILKECDYRYDDITNKNKLSILNKNNNNYYVNNIQSNETSRKCRIF